MNTVYEKRTASAIRRHIERPPDTPNGDEAVDAVKDSALSGERVLYRDRRFRVSLVTSRSPLDQRRRAYSVALRAQSDLGFYGLAKKLALWERNPLLLLGHSSDRIVTLLALERRQCDARACDWEDLSASPESWYWLPISERWVVSTVWTSAKFRRQKCATRVLHIAAEHVDLPVSRLAWHANILLSEAGARFIRQHSTGKVICVSAPTP